MSDAVRVLIRIRPPRSDLDRVRQSGIDASDAQRWNRETPDNAGFYMRYAPDNASLAIQLPAIGTNNNNTTAAPRPHQFTFDGVFQPTAKQVDVFNGAAKDTVADILKGYNATILAYGQTGSGKVWIFVFFYLRDYD